VTEVQDVVLKPLFRRHIRRPRLTALLDASTAQVILVTAPPGYGKTTLAREWIQGRMNVAWYGATATSADVGAFSAGLADTVAPVLPRAGERMRQRLRVGDATERLARPLAELLAEDLEQWPEDGIIVLDDYHLMAESAPVEDFLDRLLTLVPLRVLVTTRRRPGWASARHFLYGEAVEIGRDQLAMTDHEAAQVLRGRSTKSVRALVRQAEGWPAVIALAAMSADLAFPKERVSDSLFRYFADELLRREPPDVQGLMLAASVPAAVSSRICRDVLGFRDVEPILDRLREEDLLSETPGGELRFHPLFREFLRWRLEVDEPSALAKHAARAIEDAKEHERWEAAFGLCLEIGRDVEAAEIAGRAARTLLAEGQNETLEKWLTACGAAAVTIPGAALARAELLIRKGEMSAAAAVACETVDRLPETHPDFAWGSNLAGRALHFTSQEELAFARLEAGRRTARADEDRKDALWSLALVALELDPQMASEFLDELESEYSDDIDTRFRLAAGRAVASEQLASLVGVWPQFEALLPSIQYSRDPLAASCFLAIGAAMCVMRGRYVRGHELAEEALKLCTELRLEFGFGTCLEHRAAAEIGLRLFSKAQRTLRRFSRSPILREDPFFRLEEMRLQARLLASQGALVEALETQASIPIDRNLARPLGVYLATISIIMAASGDAAGARRMADRARLEGSSIEMRCGVQLGEAIAQGAQGKTTTFRRLAAEAIISCHRADYLDGLVFAYRVYPPLLIAGADDAEARHAIKAAMALGRDYDLAQQAGIEVRHEDSENPLGVLTLREREVLTLLAAGLSNDDIARRLVITPSTTKAHVRHIFKKLGVRNRLQAVLRAQALLETEGI
jgi:ATP/maltotriose-dependent transcriptional regulator MalT